MNGIFTTIAIAGFILAFIGIVSFTDFLTVFLVGGALSIIAKVK